MYDPPQVFFPDANMTRIQRSALVPYSPREMYDLVNDSRRYPEFLPWCTGARILADSPEERTASLDLSKGGISKSFTTINRLYPGERIEMRLKEGPFKTLSGLWRFTALGDAGCKVELDLQFEFSNKLVALAFGSIFSQIASSLVDAFQKRAVDVYGRR